MVRVSSALILGLALLAGAPAAAQIAYSVRSDGSTSATDDFLYSINLGSGIATPIGNTGFEDVESLAFAPGCATLYAVDDVTDRLLACNPVSGACTAVGPLGVNVTDTGLAFAANGFLYMSTDVPPNFYRVNHITGLATLIGDQGQEITGLAGDSEGTLFGLGGDGVDNLVRIDIVTGEATEIGPLGSAVTLVDGGLDVGASGTLYGIHDGSVGRATSSQIFTINPNTGAATVVTGVRTATGSSLDGFEGLAIASGVCAAVGGQSVVEIPTAGEWGLAALVLALGVSGIAVLRRWA
ncbi:MAG TPA: hypothetical protein VF756_27615 [Thermoanaerobaculia bacterium]